MGELNKIIDIKAPSMIHDIQHLLWFIFCPLRNSTLTGLTGHQDCYAGKILLSEKWKPVITKRHSVTVYTAVATKSANSSAKGGARLDTEGLGV